MSEDVQCPFAICPGFNRMRSEQKQAEYEVGMLKAVLLYAEQPMLMSRASPILSVVYGLQSLSQEDRARLLERYLALPEEDPETKKTVLAARRHKQLISKKRFSILSEEEISEVNDLDAAGQYVLDGLQEELLNRLHRLRDYCPLIEKGIAQLVYSGSDIVEDAFSLAKLMIPSSSEGAESQPHSFQAVNHIAQLAKALTEDSILCFDKNSADGLASQVLNPRMFWDGIIKRAKVFELPIFPTASFDQIFALRETLKDYTSRIHHGLSQASKLMTDVSLDEYSEEAAESLIDAMLASVEMQAEIKSSPDVAEILCEDKKSKKKQKSKQVQKTLSINHFASLPYPDPDRMLSILSEEDVKVLKANPYYSKWRKANPIEDRMRLVLFYE